MIYLYLVLIFIILLSIAVIVGNEAYKIVKGWLK